MDKLVLVLNANFEPIHVCNTRRAIGLILTDKAKLVINGRGVIHTVNHDFPRPSVIRLDNMIHRPRPRNLMNRREVFRRDNYTCQYCGKHSQSLTIDHVVPRHKGGEHIWTNVVAACASCNHHKGGKSAEEVGMHLLHSPKNRRPALSTCLVTIFNRMVNGRIFSSVGKSYFSNCMAIWGVTQVSIRAAIINRGMTTPIITLAQSATDRTQVSPNVSVR